jgi:hypothetical protein
VPPDSVRCTREINSELLSFGFLESHSAIIHRTVWCSTGLSGVAPDWPVRQAEQRLLRQRSTAKVNSAWTVRAELERCQKAHWTVNSSCPVRHRTVRCPSSNGQNRQNPNGWVTWMAHRTVSDGAPDCSVRPSTAPFPNG